MKETFIVRTEWFEAIKELESIDQATIFQNLFYFHTGEENLINLNNLSVKLVWRFIEPNLKRNIDVYDKRKETSSQNGKLGGRPKKEVEENLNNLKKPNNKPNETKEPNESLSVLVSVPVLVSDSVIDIKEEISKEILSEQVGVKKLSLPVFEKKEELPPVPPAPPQTVSPYGDGELHKLCREYDLSEPNKYTPEMYKEFLIYWTAKVQYGTKKELGKERWRTEKTFALSLRLSTWHGNLNKNKNYGTATKNPLGATAVFSENKDYSGRLSVVS